MVLSWKFKFVPDKKVPNSHMTHGLAFGLFSLTFLGFFMLIEKVQFEKLNLQNQVQSKDRLITELN